MATLNPDRNSASTKIASLEPEIYKSRSLFQDSLIRLSRNRAAMVGLVVIIILVLMAVFADFIAPYGYAEQNRQTQVIAPQWIVDIFPVMDGYVTISEQYPMGADSLGRDLLSRLIYGARISLSVAFIGPITAMIVGLTLGLISGYFGGFVDDLIMRFVDIVYAFPTLLFIILLMAFFRGSLSEVAQTPGTLAYTLSELDRSMGGLLFIFIGIGLTSWAGLARLTRGQVLAVREQDYVLAARAIGSDNRNIILRHVLPNILGPVVVAETLTIPVYIRYEAFLSFIGLGVQAPMPSWGQMISDGAGSIGAYPHWALFPAIALFIVMFAFNFLGDGLRDALDPRMRGVD